MAFALFDVATSYFSPATTTPHPIHSEPVTSAAAADVTGSL